MATDPNAAVFNLARERIFEITKSAAAEVVAGYAKRLKTFLASYNNKFYAVAAGLGFNVDDEPALLEGMPFYAQWNNLSITYWDKKASGGFNTGFYSRTGDLQRMIARRKPQKDWGPASVRIAEQGKGFDSSEFVEDAAGRLRYKKGTRAVVDGRSIGIGGRFASSAFYNELVFTVRFRLFSKIAPDNNNVNSLFGEAFPQGTELYNKMAVNEFGRKSGKAPYPGRPLIRPMLFWYATTNLEQEVKQQFGVNLR